MKKVIAVPVLLALAISSAVASESHQDKPDWTYEGHTGAEHWGNLHADYATCRRGQAQSPIDIQHTTVAGGELPAIAFKYAESPARVANNGHTVQIDFDSAGHIKLGDDNYTLHQFHFHTPSEERLNGEHYPLVAHMVHRSDAGELAVVAVLFKEGEKHEALERVFAAMPAKIHGKVELAEDFHPAHLLPEDQDYYHYIGSLTTPPCTEGVRWHVLKQPVEVSAEQIAAFKQLYPMNARPLQPLNGRTVGARL
ncbi:carbonic anhydrase [Azotobacter beijerinckii]|uniref:carbonic anhydrase n=1 Tax=Azotobacter beijerinckii TaxID=170623 RepID=A0A1I4CN14_9GAMM|nr:carbonic anhydrase family protein [Azotobacter beijerinckii]SFB23558.1 carbonic anhydrase [Azotobacter beijerinckii]SFK82050.1 carbonic anhydrase [Azotobacter beijerinckii]